MLFNLVLARVKQRNEAVHGKVFHRFFKFLVNVCLDSAGVLVENRCVHQLVLITCFELHAVLLTESLLHLIEGRVEDDLLEAAHHNVKVVVIFVASRVANFEILVILIVTIDLHVSA